jgi:Tfp pilus assembly protein PilN
MDKSALKMPQINLVRQKGIYINTFLHWALTTGRLLIIITETVALSAFALRFSLDSQIVDLHDKIRQEQAIVSLLKHNEDTYRNLQDRLSLIKQADSSSQKESRLFFSLLKLVPNTVQVTSFNFFPDKLQLQIDTNSTATLDSFVNTLSTQPGIANVSIDKIENRISQGVISVAISAAIK